MNDFKVYASRALNRAGFDAPERKRWTRHGSTRKLWTHEDVEAAIHYVVHEQGEPMALFEDRAAIPRLESELEKVSPHRAATVRERHTTPPSETIAKRRLAQERGDDSSQSRESGDRKADAGAGEGGPADSIR
jgi:hypothetical protein